MGASHHDGRPGEVRARGRLDRLLQVHRRQPGRAAWGEPEIVDAGTLGTRPQHIARAAGEVAGSMRSAGAADGMQLQYGDKAARPFGSSPMSAARARSQ
jgi:hypothetical protein